MKRTQVYFDPADYKQIEILANQRGIKKAAMTRAVIKAGIKLIKEEAKKNKDTPSQALTNIAKLGEKYPTLNNQIDSSNIDTYLYKK